MIILNPFQSFLKTFITVKNLILSLLLLCEIHKIRPKTYAYIGEFTAKFYVRVCIVTLRTFDKHLGDISVDLITLELHAHSSGIKMSG